MWVRSSRETMLSYVTIVKQSDRLPIIWEKNHNLREFSSSDTYYVLLFLNFGGVEKKTKVEGLLLQICIRCYQW
jgi:hypothetical protein